MEILSQYNNSTLQLISDGQDYSLPNFWEYYVDTYFDLKNTWDGGVGNWWINQGADSKENFGRVHWELYGQAEGRGYPQIKSSIFTDRGTFLASESLIEKLSSGLIFPCGILMFSGRISMCLNRCSFIK